MANIKRLDPGASPLHYFGAELRRLREVSGLTLEQLGGIVYLTGSMLGQIETATKTPKNEHVPRLDAALGADGALTRAWELAKRHRLPDWLARIAEMEESATQICVFQTQLVPGLLQTDGYARAVLGVMWRDDLEAQVEARLRRQDLLSRKGGRPLLWVILDEAVLHRRIGSRRVMRKQLAHLLAFDRTNRVQIQVLPFDAGAHTGLSGSFNLYTFEDQADVAFSDTYEDGWATANPTDVTARSLRYDLLRATALSPTDSASLIARVMEERYGDDSEQAPPPVA